MEVITGIWVITNGSNKGKLAEFCLKLSTKYMVN